MGSEYVKTHEKAKELILQLLREEERCRNDDLFLIFRVWQKQGYTLQIDEVGIVCSKKVIPYSPETIRRNRAHIQNVQGKYLPTDPNVMIERKIKEDSLKKYYGERSTEFQSYLNNKYM